MIGCDAGIIFHINRIQQIFPRATAAALAIDSRNKHADIHCTADARQRHLFLSKIDALFGIGAEGDRISANLCRFRYM